MTSAQRDKADVLDHLKQHEDHWNELAPQNRELLIATSVLVGLHGLDNPVIYAASMEIRRMGLPPTGDNMNSVIVLMLRLCADKLESEAPGPEFDERHPL